MMLSTPTLIVFTHSVQISIAQERRYSGNQRAVVKTLHSLVPREHGVGAYELALDEEHHAWTMC